MTKQMSKTGSIAWMAQNSVAANLLMAVLLLGGLVSMLRVKQEVFPAFDIDTITVAAGYPGASPDEIEKSIVVAIEDSIRDVDGIKKISSRALEGSGQVYAELRNGANPERTLSEVKTAVDRITSFPEDMERPNTSLMASRRSVISIMIYGDVGEQVLKSMSDIFYEDLLAMEAITTVDVRGLPPPEISIEISQKALRQHGLTIEGVARTIRNASVEVPGGGVKTQRGEILLRVTERREFGREFSDIIVKSGRNGNQVKLSEVAQIRDDFKETDQSASFNGKPAIRLTVMRVGNQKPLEIANAVKQYVNDMRPTLPEGVQVATWGDQSEIYKDRIGLLTRNGIYGLFLVLGVLGLILDFRLAFWVTLGIPISFFGSLIFFPAADASINMVSMMAFIITLGMVVDDAIVVGENIFTTRKTEKDPNVASIAGAHEVSVPVVFSILTTVSAFAPLFFVSGVMGKILWSVPFVVVSVLLLSLVESLYILPAHLAHTPLEPTNAILKKLQIIPIRANRILDNFIENQFQPVLRKAVEYRGLTIAIGFSGLIITIGLIAGGRIGATFLPRIPANRVQVSVELPYGTSVAYTKTVQTKLIEAAQKTAKSFGTQNGDIRGIYGLIGKRLRGGGPVNTGSGAAGGHIAGVSVLLAENDKRSYGARQFTQKWRETIGEIPGVKSISFKFSRGPSGGAAINVELSHPSKDTLEEAARRTAELLQSFDGVRDIDTGFDDGKPQIDFTLKPAARTLGITEVNLGRQLRSSFFGSEALRQQRGRDELRVMVRLPENERRTQSDVENLIVQSPSGGEIPLKEAANISFGTSFTAIKRVGGRRAVNVTADVDEKKANAKVVAERFVQEILPKIASEYPGIKYSLEGEQRERKESFASMAQGGLIALVVIFGLLAIPFRSYVQPIIIMTAIPFGLVGAVIGHLVMGYSLSLISMFGLVALTGVTVNDSLILVVAINRYRESGHSLFEAVVFGGMRRFRPIVLTSATTFLGLAPMIFETSTQARFLIPMALSLGYGILFATVVILLIVPARYMSVESFKLWLNEEDPNAKSVALEEEYSTPGG
ncbi:MAG: efflux RND transporter permease subunit [Myxococcota bacterium]|nr:efflux RND transporter permease subunit [Myxococcota bacterium]